jgi:ABC-type microcin C transport system permease subunit YejB
MLKFIVRRLLLLVPILLGLSLLVFIWIRALPGGPAEALNGLAALIRGEIGAEDWVAGLRRVERSRRAA